MPADLSGPGRGPLPGGDRTRRPRRSSPRRPSRCASRPCSARATSTRRALAAAQQPPTIDGARAADRGTTRRRFLVANIGAVLILVGIFSFGFTVLTGVVEEKQSRVVEVVLSTVRPRDLLMGKVLGIGVLGIVQLAVFVMAAMIAALARTA